jgi:hypothetical protein
LTIIWNTVKHLYSVERLLASEFFSTIKGSENVRQYLQSNDIPPRFFARRTVDDGRILVTNAYLFSNGTRFGGRLGLNVRFIGDGIVNPEAHHIRVVKTFESDAGEIALGTLGVVHPFGEVVVTPVATDTSRVAQVLKGQLLPV